MTGTPASIERPEEHVSTSRNPLLNFSSAWIFLILVGMVVVFGAVEGRPFLNPSNFQNILIDAAELLLLAIGSTFVIITAGIDLSVGAVLIFSSVVCAKVMVRLSGTAEQVQNYQWPHQNVAIPIGIAAGLVAGLGWGLVNGLLVTKLKMPPFIVTLGTLGMALGIAEILSSGTNVPFVPEAISDPIGSWEFLPFFPKQGWLQLLRLPLPVFISLIVVIVSALLLGKTQFGRHTYAIGSNAAAARRVGINVDRHLLKVYAYAGFLAGVAGVMDVARFNTASVSTHSSDNLAAISAVVIGGTSLFGGLGTIGGTVVGTFIPAVLRNGLVIKGIQSFYQDVAIGAILILAVFIDQRRRKSEERM